MTNDVMVAKLRCKDLISYSRSSITMYFKEMGSFWTFTIQSKWAQLFGLSIDMPKLIDLYSMLLGSLKLKL